MMFRLFCSARKQCVFFFACAFLCARMFSAGGVLAGSSGAVQVVRTDYFDIVFPEECAPSAEQVAAVCDEYYREICALLGVLPEQRFPVTLTRSVDVLNAYYSAVPYNRIVLYDTIPDKSLDMYESTIQSVFYHELVHAVTYNMKSPALKKLSVFSDALNPAWLTLTTFWAEGATVSFESRGRGGRLSDPFSTQIVNQAKIEGTFPSWRDVTGACDTFPGGTDAYMFGACFADYVQRTFGMEKYGEFWRNAGSSFSLAFAAGVFRKTYGKSIDEVWREFADSRSVQAGQKNAVLLSHKNAVVPTFDVQYDSLSGAERVVYFDRLSQSVRLAEFAPDGKRTDRKLFASSGITRLSFSADGTRVAVSRSVSKKNATYQSGFYDIKRRAYRRVGADGMRDAFFSASGELGGVNARASGSERRCREVECAPDEIPFSPVSVPGGDGLCAAIVKRALRWSVRLCKDGAAVADYDFSALPGGSDGGEGSLILHNLHFVRADLCSLVFSFSWAELGRGGEMLSRAGFLRIERDSYSCEAYFQKENGFAGVIEAVPSPASVEAAFGGQVSDAPLDFFVSAAEYERNPLYRVRMRVSDFESVAVPYRAEIHALPREDAGSGGNGISFPFGGSVQPLRPAQLYNPLPYYARGILLPFPFVASYSHDFAADSSALLGVSFISSQPWGDAVVCLSSGYDVLYRNGGVSVQVSGGNDSFSYSLLGTCIFDGAGFMQTVENVSLSKTVWRGHVGSLSVGCSGSFLHGRQLCDDEIGRNRDDSTGNSADASLFVSFSNVHKVSPPVFSRAGFTLRPYILSSYRSSDVLECDVYLNAGVSSSFSVPLPLPLVLSASLFPSADYVLSFGAEAVLLDFEIHKGIPALSVFAQRVAVSAAYLGTVGCAHGEFWDILKTVELLRQSGADDYTDVLRASADFYFSPNTSEFANGDIQFCLRAFFLCRPHRREDDRMLSAGLTLRLAY